MAKQCGGTVRSDKTGSPVIRTVLPSLVARVLLFRGFDTLISKRFKRLTRIFTFCEKLSVSAGSGFRDAMVDPNCRPVDRPAIRA